MRSDDPAPAGPMGLFDWGLLILLSVLWGGSFFFNRVALDALPPLTVVALRFALATLGLGGLLALRGVSLPADGKTWAALFTTAAFNSVLPATLIVFAQTRIASGLAAILTAATPLFTVVVAHLLTADEKLAVHKIAGVLLGLVGVVVMIGTDALEGFGADVPAQAAVLAAALCYALAGVQGRRFRGMGLTPLATATGQLAATSVILVPLSLVVDRPWSLLWPSPVICAAVLAAALLSTALAFVIYFQVLHSAGATNVLLVTFLIPVSAVVLGTLVLGERLAPQHVFGMTLIGLGLGAIDGRPLRRLGDSFRSRAAWRGASAAPRADRRARDAADSGPSSRL